MQPNKPQKHSQQHPQQFTAEFYQGIIPKPEDLQKYEAIKPGFADRLIKLTEEEVIHRRAMERKVVNGSVGTVYFGQTLGFLAVCSVIYLCYQFLIHGEAVSGASLASAVLIGLAWVFVTGKRKVNQS